jgi:hypothetical protein
MFCAYIGELACAIDCTRERLVDGVLQFIETLSGNLSQPTKAERMPPKHREAMGYRYIRRPLNSEARTVTWVS